MFKSITKVFFGLFLIAGVFTYVQAQKTEKLPVYKAEAAKEISDEQYEEENAGCSWYCGVSDIVVSATSTLPHSKGGINYKASNIHDFNLKTAWAEGKEGDGIGEKIHFDILSKDIGTNKNLTITGLTIFNGYRKSSQLWKENSRVKKLKMYVNNKPYALLELVDTFNPQTVYFKSIQVFPENKDKRISFEILEVYKGEKYSDTVLSQIEFFGDGVH